jgi:WD40 repeat protein
MPGKERSGVFLSYARTDGEDFARMLRDRLRDKAPDIVIKQDRLLLEGGVGWWKQLTEAIDSVEFLVLVMTPSAMQSETVRKEWRYARQAGVCVYPVKGAPDSELRFADLPRWMSKANFYDLDKEWEKFVAHLRKGCDTPRVLFMPPDLPENFIQRPDEFGRLKNLLLSSDRKEPVAITTALSGAGGFGKTTLATALCHDEDIIQNFDDGILWVTLGQNPNVMSGLITAYAALTGERPGFASEEDAAFQLGQRLEDRTCLLVIDDIWDESHLRPFLRGGKGCARLFTTRNAEIASNARSINVDEMSGAESQALISKGVPGLDPVRARELSQKLGEWPLALELASAMMRQRTEQGATAERAAQRLLDILAMEGPQILETGIGNPQHRTIGSVLHGSLELLSGEDRACLTELSIFPEDIAIPLSEAATFWGLNELKAERTAQRFARLNLLKLDLARGSMRLHDVMRSWLVAATTNTAELHNRLVDAWPDWEQLPNSYAWRWLTWHLAQAGRRDDIEKLLWDPAWLQAKLKATDVNALIGDFEYLMPAREAALIQGALRLSSHILAKDPSQITCQMVGRLLPWDYLEAITQFTALLTKIAECPWLRPMQPALDPPGTGLLRTLVGHSNFVNDVAVSADGRRAISASRDKTLRVWDLQTGHEPRVVASHLDVVSGVAMTPDGCRAVSASWDKTLRVWDLDTGQELHALVGHSGSVSRVSVTSDGCRAVSASWDHTLKVWDLKTGQELHRLVGHSGPVFGVEVDPDGRRVVSASWDKLLKVWDLDTGGELRTLAGHSGGVNDVALSPDGRRAVSASDDKTLKVWDLETGNVLRTLVGHSGRVNDVAVSADGRRAVSASDDKTLKVWDLETGREVRTLAGHSREVLCVAVTPDGRRAVSASSDKTLKVWDVEAGVKLPILAGHSRGITGVVATLDGCRAVSASRDNTLKVWDVETGSELRTLAGHSHEVLCVAMTPDGCHAVSAGDKTLRVWDLKSGQELNAFPSHSDLVTGVAITSDGQRAICACNDNTLRVRDLETGDTLRTLIGHSHEVLCVAMTPEGDYAISGSWDHTLKVWGLTMGYELCRLVGHLDSVSGVALTPDCRRAVSASWDKTLKVWDLKRGKELRTLASHSRAVNGVAVSPDGRRAVSVSSDNTVKVWDLETGACIATFSCDSSAQCCTFADDSTIVAGDDVGRVHFLSLELPEQG